MKTIVTHISVDLDAISSAWLIKRYIQGWEDAVLKFVNAGETLDGKAPDENPDVIHVDTGLGKFDHHQQKDMKMSATKKVFNYLNKNDLIRKGDIEALSRMADFITTTDNFQEVYFPEPDADIYDFGIHQIVTGLRPIVEEDEERCELMFKILDAILMLFKNKVRAEHELKEAYTFKSKWGETLAIESQNEETIKLAQKKGFEMVIRKDPKLGFIRIKTIPSDKLDLTPLYEKLTQEDKEADWFLHISKNMLLNGSVKKPKTKASRLSLNKVIAIVRNI
ncbi:MAG: chromate resistance protein ChrB domain-containing protein [bacterium]